MPSVRALAFQISSFFLLSPSLIPLIQSEPEIASEMDGQ